MERGEPAPADRLWWKRGRRLDPSHNETHIGPQTSNCSLVKFSERSWFWVNAEKVSSSLVALQARVVSSAALTISLVLTLAALTRVTLAHEAFIRLRLAGAECRRARMQMQFTKDVSGFLRWQESFVQMC